MFCENCGNKLPDDARFCDVCGCKVSAPEQGVSAQPVQQQVQQPVQQPIQQPIQQTPSARTPMSLFTKVLLVEAVLLVILAGVFFVKSKEYMSPEKTAKMYFNAVMAGNQKKAYDLIEIDESGFVNEKYFGNVVEQIGCKNITNFKVEDIGEQSDDYAREVKITYRLKEDTQDYDFYVKLEKANAKKFLFFDDWKVNVGDYLQKDVHFSVIKGSTMTVDGEDLGKKYLTDSDKEASVDEYVIPKMFYGTYQIVVKNDIYNDYQTSVTVDGEEDSFSEDFDSVSVKKEAMQNVLKQSKTDFQLLWNGAAKKQDFMKLTGIQMTQDTSELQDTYSRLAGYFISEDGDGLKKMSFQNIAVNAEEYEGYGESFAPMVRVEFTTKYNCTKTELNWWTNEPEESDDSGDYTGVLYYSYEEGDWVLSDMSIADFYY